MTLLALVTAGVLLAMWFPMKALMSQQREIAVASRQISAIQHEQQVLSSQARSISSKANATLLARQQYQLVAQGQSLIQVLPGTEPGQPSPWTGDPGDQPLVAPSSVSSLVHVNRDAAHAHSAGFLQRLLRTLEFWK